MNQARELQWKNRSFVIGLSAWLVCFAVLSLRAETSADPTLGRSKSIREFSVLPGNSGAVNKANLQAAIDWASTNGAALFVEPSNEPYPVDSGLILKRNASLIGVHGPVGRGTSDPPKEQPVGSVFRIEDARYPFITVESATQLRGIQFWYPNQTLSDPAKIIEYPPTIQVSKDSSTNGVTLSCLTFFGEYITMDFNATAKHACEQILFEHCYGYPLSGEFIKVDHCYDIPRVLHCHVNPSIQRLIKDDYSKAVVDSVVNRGTFSYAFNHTDNAQLIDLFAFGVYGGIYLGPDTYGQLTSFNLDCVSVGIEKHGANDFNRNWQIAQGAIVANAGLLLSEIHPLIIEGLGHTSLSNVECFSGGNAALTNVAKCQDYLLIKGDQPLSVSLFGCRMANYVADNPITVLDKKATIQAVACIDKNDNLFNVTIKPKVALKSPPPRTKSKRSVTVAH